MYVQKHKIHSCLMQYESPICFYTKFISFASYIYKNGWEIYMLFKNNVPKMFTEDSCIFSYLLIPFYVEAWTSFWKTNTSSATKKPVLKTPCQRCILIIIYCGECWMIGQQVDKQTVNWTNKQVYGLYWLWSKYSHSYFTDTETNVIKTILGRMLVETKHKQTTKHPVTLYHVLFFTKVVCFVSVYIELCVRSLV